MRESPNDIRSITADMRVGAPISFVVAEEARELPDNLAFVRVGLEGSVMATGLREVAGWPTITDTRGAQVPERAISVSIDLDAKGIPWIAIVTEIAGFVGGRLDGSLHLLRGPLGHRNVWPHVAGLADSMALSCFDETGMLFHYRPGPDDQ